MCLPMTGFIASLGLTVALFVATAAYPDAVLQGQAKMGALLSGIVGLAAVAYSAAKRRASADLGDRVDRPDESRAPRSETGQ